MNAQLSEMTQAPTLYEAVAERITHLIVQGTLREGDRIPSVRGLSRQMRVSLSTVMEAYRLLEDRGLIEARPQSGHYVSATLPQSQPQPEISRPALNPTHVSMSDMVMMVMQDMRNPALAQLGAALPNTETLPFEKLNRALATVARRAGPSGGFYSATTGCAELRVQVARRLMIAGCSVSPEEIIVTSGCQEAIVLALRAVCRPGDTVAIESPLFYNFLQAIEMLGLRALELPTDPREGICLSALQDALEQYPIRACLCIANFSNPLGSLMPAEKKRELVNILARRDIPLIEDDIYGDLGYGPERPALAKAFDRKGLVLSCSSYSKTLSPGYRVGWIAPGRFQKEVERLKLVTNIATATLPQLAVAECLANGGYDHHLRRVRQVYARQTAQMAQAVSRWFPSGTKVTRPTGGYVLWVECPPSVDALALYEAAIPRGIAFAPGPIFTAQDRYRNCLRLNAANWSEPIAAAVATLGRLAAQ